MMTENENNRSDILTLINNSQFQGDTAQIRAKSILTQILKKVDDIDWTYIIQNIIRNLTFLTFELENILGENTNESEDIFKAAQKCAFIWEALGILQEGTSRDFAQINAAITYELAGYQANALCMVKNFNPEVSKKEKPSLIDLSRIFLQRRLIKLSYFCNKAMEEPIKRKFDAELMEEIALGLAGKAFSNLVNYFLSGNNSAINQATKVFKNANKLYNYLGYFNESNIIRSFLNLIPFLKKRSIWNILYDFAPANPKWSRYLKLLARGLGQSIFDGRSISELWQSQISAIEKGLLDDKAHKFIKMPTSAGKTRIAELAMVFTLINNPEAKCIYVAPYRALVSEIYQTFLTLFHDLGFQVSSTSGAYETDDFEELLFQETHIIIITPEKLDLVFRTFPEFFDKVQLIVFDEVHLFHDNNRGIKFELLLTRLKRKLSHTRFLTLSAVLSQETLVDFANWFNSSPKRDIMTSDWRPSIQRYANFRWKLDRGFIRYMPQDDLKNLEKFLPGVITQHEYEYIYPKTRRKRKRTFPEKNSKAQTAAELAFKYAELGPVLIFCSQSNWAEDTVNALRKRIKYLRYTNLSIPHYFFGSKDTSSYILSKEWLGEKHLVTKALKDGIALHHGKIPHIVRTSIEKDFRQKQMRIIVATNTLAQGVNLPIRTIIIHTCKRWTEDSPSKRISVLDYWNIAGRAGRAGEETSGLVIHIINSFKDELDFKYYNRHRQKLGEIKSALFKKLIKLVQERFQIEELEEFKYDLNPEILAILVEENQGSISLELIQNFMNETLVQVQASKSKYPLTKLNAVVFSIAEKIYNDVKDPNLRAIYSTTGLSSDSCLLIQEKILVNQKVLEELLINAEYRDLDQLIELLIPFCLLLPELQPLYEFSGNYIDLIKSWINGKEVHALMDEFSEYIDTFERLGRFIDDLIKYKLPWGVSSFFRIAIELLEIDRSKLSLYAKFIPSMIKFGVPNPIACWAMSIGIPSRKIAIKIVSFYQDSNMELNYEKFLEWIGTIDMEDLRYEFNLEGALLEDISKIILYSGINPLLKEYKKIDEFIPISIDVRGIQYESRENIAHQVKIKDEVNLIRDYKNMIDRNAIAVNWQNQQLGYIPRVIAQILAPEIDSGVILSGEIIEINKSSSVPNIKIRIFQLIK